MKLTLIAAISLSTLASGLALPDLTPRATVIRPEFRVLVREEPGPMIPLPPDIVEVSRGNGGTVRAFLCFVVPACTGMCTISFSNAISATGSRTLQLFRTFGCPAGGTLPPTDAHLGTFLVPASGTGPAVVLEDYGLTFPCPVTTTKYGYEVQPVGDNISVTWNITNGGFVITCY